MFVAARYHMKALKDCQASGPSQLGLTNRLQPCWMPRFYGFCPTNKCGRRAMRQPQFECQDEEE